MKKRLLMLLAGLLACVLLALPAGAEMSESEMYEKYIDQLRRHVNCDEAEIPLGELPDLFYAMGNYELSFQFGLYAQAFSAAREGALADAHVYIRLLKSQAQFNAWLAAEESFGTVEQLEWFVKARELDNAYRFEEAEEAYAQAGDFFCSAFDVLAWRARLVAAQVTPTPFVRSVKKENVKVGDYKITTYDDGTCDITDYTGMATSLEIPAQIDGHRVTGIGEEAFYYYDSLTSVTIPEGVTSIGDYAFCSCESLTNVSIPASVTSIGDNPFRECIALTKITVSSGNPLFEVQDGALFGEEDKRLICYPQGLTAKTYVIPQGTEIIGSHAFYYCLSLTSVTIPEGVTSIGDGAFDICVSLTSVTIPEGVTSIGDWAFSFCESLTSVTIPESVTSIGEDAFSFCDSLTSVTIPEGVTSIGDYAFSYCDSLTSVAIPASVTEIGFSAFYDSSNVTLRVPRNSTAATYAQRNYIPYTYTD